MNIVCYCPQSYNPNNYGKTIFHGTIQKLSTVNRILKEAGYQVTFAHDPETALLIPEEVDLLFVVPALPPWMYDRDGYRDLLLRSRYVAWIIDGAESDKIRGSRGNMDDRFCKVNSNQIFMYYFYYDRCKHKPAIHFPWNYFNDFHPRMERIPYKINGLLYYGNFRDERISSFKRFLIANYPTHICGNPNHHLKFRDAGIKKASFYKGQSFSMMRLFQSTLYITDDDLQSLTFPGARLFECLSMGLLMFVDEYAISNFAPLGGAKAFAEGQVVTGPKDIKSGLKHSEELRQRFLAIHEERNYFETAKRKLLEFVKGVKRNVLS